MRSEKQAGPLGSAGQEQGGGGQLAFEWLQYIRADPFLSIAKKGRLCEVCKERYQGRGTRIISGHTVCPSCAEIAADLDREVMGG